MFTVWEGVKIPNKVFFLVEEMRLLGLSSNETRRRVVGLEVAIVDTIVLFDSGLVHYPSYTHTYTVSTKLGVRHEKEKKIV